MADSRSPRRAPKPAAVVHTAAMRHPDGTGCSWRGRSFASDAKGVVTVPVEAATELAGHGFGFVAE